MENRWSEEYAGKFINLYTNQWGEDLALRTYSGRLLGMDKSLVLHGGGNTSVKGVFTDILGNPVPAIYIKASGWDLASIRPEGQPALNLEYLTQLRALPGMNDVTMANVLRSQLLDARSPSPSIEALLHVFLPQKFIDHTHADAILTLSNQAGGEGLLREALGKGVIVLPYVHPGYALAKAAAEAFAKAPESRAMVLMKHGLVTWGESARESYEATIELVTLAEQFITRRSSGPVAARRVTMQPNARERYRRIAPRLRGLLSAASGDPDRPRRTVILRPLINREVINLVDSGRGEEILVTPPLTGDHLIRTRPLPLWLGDLERIDAAVAAYRQAYEAYFNRHADRNEPPVSFDSAPRVVFIPGVGAVCAGQDVAEADRLRDITAQAVAVKGRVAAMGVYEGLSERDLYEMEYFPLQLAKLSEELAPLAGRVAFVTGAAGAIGSGICRSLLANGCHVAASDLPGEALDGLVLELKKEHGERLEGVAMDVTDVKKVAEGLRQVVELWGGVDLLVINAGLAHVSSLADMDGAMFQKLQRVNVEGTLHMLSQGGRLLTEQGTGGDVVLISTKNVFAPGASFGAYSATKAAAHQLARIASLELAEKDIRVNMVAPDGVFSDGARKSGLWAEVGPERMKARGLDAAGLEAYYQNRNLLKARITADHVARGVLFFATRQTPTTGATLPVDGGLPDATPR